MLPWLYYILLVAALLGGLFLCVLTLPGLWAMTVVAGIYGAATHWEFIGAKTLIILLILSFAAEGVELGLGGAAAKKAGGGKRAMIGGVIGGILGGIFLTFIPIPIISTIFGICLGSFLGAGLFELLGGERVPHSLNVGWGAAKGRFYGIVSKLIFGALMLAITMVVALPIGGSKPAAIRMLPTTSPATTHSS